MGGRGAVGEATSLADRGGVHGNEDPPSRTAEEEAFWEEAKAPIFSRGTAENLPSEQDSRGALRPGGEAIRTACSEHSERGGQGLLGQNCLLPMLVGESLTKRCNNNQGPPNG